MGARVCSTPGCGKLVSAGVRGGRCKPCERGHDRARGTREERGYDAHHRAERAALQDQMDAGQTFHCWRCPALIDPHDWCLGHCDDDRSIHHGPECGSCNYATGTRRGVRCPHPSHTKRT